MPERRMRKRLLSTTAALLMLGPAMLVVGCTAASDQVESTAAAPCNPSAAANPCNPCAAANPCNPCAADNPCNPCATGNPCNPCAAGAGGFGTECTVPRLMEMAALKGPCGPCAAASPCNPCAAANPCNPCAAANPCNPCATAGSGNPCAAANAGNPCAAANPRATANPCNPCATANPCSPCAAANPCNPCAAANPCNPCTAAEVEPPELTEAELVAAYDCVIPYLEAAYAAAGSEVVATYRSWARFSRTAYPAEAHGVRFMNNYANAVGAETYGRWEGLGPMPVGSVLAKDSFIVADDGNISVGPLFVMEKRAAGYSAEARDWSYQMIMPGGVVQADASVQAFCNGCHRRAGEADDFLMFLPDDYRVGGISG